YAPHGSIEKQVVQTIIDCYWRLNCVRAWELTLFADVHEQAEGEFEIENPGIEAAFTAAKTISDKAAELKTISLYEQRINKVLQTATKQWGEMKAERSKREEVEMHQAAKIENLFKMKGETYNPADDG